jgi:hypothetical protein
MNNTYNRMFNLMVDNGRTDEIASARPFVPTGVTKGGAPTEYGRSKGSVTKGGASVTAAGTSKGGTPTILGGIKPDEITSGGARTDVKTTNKGGAPSRYGRVKGATNAGGRRIS